VGAGLTALVVGAMATACARHESPPVCRGVELVPGADIRSEIDRHPGGTTFCLRPGLYRNQEVTPKSGDVFVGSADVVLSGARVLDGFERQGDVWAIGGQTQESEPHGECLAEAPRCNRNEDLYVDDALVRHVADRDAVGPGTWYFDYGADTIYLGDDPAGKRVEVAVTDRAFGGAAADVTLRGFTVEKYANATQHGAIYPERATGWVIDGVTARWNHGAGVGWTLSDHMTLRGAVLAHNGQIGVVGDGDDNLVEGNEIFGNNTAGVDPGWEAGGAKFGGSQRLVIRGNDSHDNDGPGLWTDADNREVLYEGNRVVRNSGAGIFHEISYDAVIRNNEVAENGLGSHDWCYGAGIQISASRNVEVYGNRLSDNARSIVGIAQDRGADHVVSNLDVHDNVTANSEVVGSITGLCRDDEGLAVYAPESNNRFTHNNYLGSGHEWYWDDGPMTFEEWQRRGNDRAGNFDP
jgi:parallel beta-helix repeat protein